MASALEVVFGPLTVWVAPTGTAFPATNAAPAGGTVPRKVTRSAESLLIEFTLVDLTPEQYAKILNDATVTTTVGPPATKSFNLMQGTTVAQFALLARGVSDALGATLPAQYQVPIAYQASSPKPSFQKDKPAGLDCQFAPLEDPALGMGSLVIQTA